jgi:hypothetical protein
MTDPTDDHPFTFGCFRAVETPDIPPIDEPTAATDHDVPFDDPDAADSGKTASRTPVTDGGPALPGECPTCEGDLANVQGVPACPDCTWTAN